MATFAVILPAAGKSTRFASENDFAPGGQSSNSQKKPFVELSGRAIWLRAAELFANRDDVVQTIIVIAPDDIEWFKEKFRPNLAFMDIEIVAGGAERADSVPRIFIKIHAVFTVIGKGVSLAKAEEAVELSGKKYCSASRMLKKSANITFETIVVEAD